MRNLLKTSLLASVAPALILSATAAAQEAPPADADDGAIVVTAQKREERLLNVPVAVSAVSADSLVDQNLVSLKDFYTRVPGIQLSGGGTQDISLRGITAGGDTNPTVAILIDDVQFGSSTHLAKPPLPDFDPAALERIEVLRGPQGTLYGASSLGGLIKYVTREPDTNNWSGRAEVGVNSVANGGEGWSVRGSLNVPIVEDRIGATISAYYRDDPRYVDNILPSGELAADTNKNVVWGGRAALTVKPFENLTITGSALLQRRKFALTDSIFVCSTCDVSPGSSTPVVLDPRTVPNLRTTRGAVVPGDEELQLYTLRSTLDFDEIQLVSISAWGASRQGNSQDFTARFGPPVLENPDFGPSYPAGGTYIYDEPVKTHKFSQELRLQGTSDAADWMLGAFYTNERSSLLSVIRRTGNAPEVVVYDGSNLSTYEEKAVFGDVTVHLTPAFDVQAGIRYASNRQTYRVASTIDVPAQPVFGPGEDNSFTSKDDAITWLLTPSYRFNQDLMVYARLASGYRPGGPNTDTPGAARTYGSDTVMSYELGVKGQLFDRRLTIDASIFQVNWKDIQLQNTALPSQFIFFENGNKARSRGLEIAASLRPMSGLTIDANATLLDAELTQPLDRSTATVQRLFGNAGDRLPYSAKFSSNIGAEQKFDISGDVSGSLGFNISYVGNRLGVFNQDSASAVIPRAKIPSYTTVDLRAGLTVHGMWKLNAYVTNLFDKHGVTSIDTSNGTILPRAVFIRPRTIGLIASVDF